MGVETLHLLDVLGLEVGGAVEQVGKGLAVVVVVVVEQELWRLGENLCLRCDFFADVEGMGVGRDLGMISNFATGFQKVPFFSK